MAKFLLSAFADEAGGGIADQIEALKANGFTHIEPRGLDLGNISDYTPEEAVELKKILDDNGIGVSSIGSPYGKIEITDDFAPHFESFKKTTEVAEILGAKYIRMFSFFFTDDEKFEDYRDEVLERVEKFADYSLRSDILCCHENEKEIYGDTAERCYDLLSSLGGKLGGIFDPANFVQTGVDILPAYDLLEPYITYMHIKDCRYEDGFVVPCGKGDGKIVELLRRFSLKDGERFLTLEPHLKVFKGLSALENKGGQADKLKDNYTYPTNRAAFDAAASAMLDCIAQAQDKI
ncbi:MAG: sugar phosphate isomerase/epimerase [Clostridiales bacterium]|nr:sugar phosphate isomerase/epimerase [Clostridiales bacterium]